MNMKRTIGGALAGLVLVGGITGLVNAQTVANAMDVSEEQAIAIALAQVPGQVTEVELEREDGQTIYEVEITAEDGTQMEIEISAQTGDILMVEADTDDCKHDRDDDDEA